MRLVAVNRPGYGRSDPHESDHVSVADDTARNGRWLADRIPGATLVIRQQSSHLGALLEHWDEMLTTLRPHSPNGLGDLTRSGY